MGKFFEDLKEGLEDIVAYQKGKKTLRTRLIELPEPHTYEIVAYARLRRLKSTLQYGSLPSIPTPLNP